MRPVVVLVDDNGFSSDEARRTEGAGHYTCATMENVTYRFPCGLFESHLPWHVIAENWNQVFVVGICQFLL